MEICQFGTISVVVNAVTQVPQEGYFGLPHTHFFRQPLRGLI